MPTYPLSLTQNPSELYIQEKELGTRCKDGHRPCFGGNMGFATLLARTGPKHRTDALAWDMGGDSWSKHWEHCLYILMYTAV